VSSPYNDAKKHTPTIAKLLTVNWVDAEWPMTTVPGYGKQMATGFGELVSSVQKRVKKPVVVYVTKSQTEEERQESDRAMLGNEDVVFALRFFHAVRIDAKDIGDPALRDQFTQSAPAMVFFQMDGTQAGEMSGRIDGGSLLGRLDKVFATAYEGRLTSQVTKIIETIGRFERQEDKVADLKKRFDDLKSKSEDATAKNVVEAKKKYEDARKDLDKIGEERDRLLTPTLRTAEKDVVKGG
jgi:hypothetical protein